MILVTGGTGFIGRVLIRQLVATGYAVRTLIRPSQETPNLPQGVPVEVALAEITNEESLRAALVGVETVYHLVGGEAMGPGVDLARADGQGTRALVSAAQQAGVKRIIYLSHLGADRASAYPVMKAKGIAEEYIRHGYLEHIIVRSSLIYGPEDHFTNDIATLLHAFPFIFPLPGQGEALLQPVWVEDIATCLVWALENPELVNKTVSVGGPEFLTMEQIVAEVMAVLGLRRQMWYFAPSYMRPLTVQMNYFFPNLPISTYWLDYLAVNRTTGIDSISRQFGLLPARFSHKLDYLKEGNYRRAARQAWFGRRRDG